MKLLSVIIFALLSQFISTNTHGSVPTEEGLMMNLNNAELSGPVVIIKSLIQNTTSSSEPQYVKWIINAEANQPISLLQAIYTNAQMLNDQVVKVVLIPDLVGEIKKERSIERAMFYASLISIALNRSVGMETFLEKNGVTVSKNKNLLNEDKMRLLKAYRGHLASGKNVGAVGSPLNPEDPKLKERNLELFRSNTFKRAKNIELVKKDNEFLWKVDWKNVQGFFTNEERRFRLLNYSTPDNHIQISFNQYQIFNGVNELPKLITLKDSKLEEQKIQFLSFDNRSKLEKNLRDQLEEMKRSKSIRDIDISYLF